MVTNDELLRVVLAPFLVAAAVAALGRWRRWAWAMPLAAGAGFLTGYALIGVPRFPPLDGTDWLFWLAFPVTALGILDATIGRRWGWALGLVAGVVAMVIVRPLVPSAVPSDTWWITGAALAVAGLVLVYAMDFAERRTGPLWVIGALCVTVGAAAVVIMSSNLRIGGIYGIAAAAPLGATALACANWRLDKRVPGRAVAVVAVPLLAGLLAGGRFYPDPGVRLDHFAILFAAPLVLLAGAALPLRRTWLRGLIGVLLVAALVAVITVPTALAAKKAAEEDPYADMYG